MAGNCPDWTSKLRRGAPCALRAGVLPATALLVGLGLFLAYFPGLYHQDSLTRWACAVTAVSGEGLLKPSDFWHPFLTGVYYGVLHAGLPVWSVHLVQLLAFFAGYVLLAHRIIAGLGGRVLAALVLLVPATWHYAVLQSADSWLITGLMWLLWGFFGYMRAGPLATWRAGADLAALLGGGILLFCTRYNAAPMVLPLVLLPFLLKAPWRRAVAMAAISVAAFTASKAYRGPVEVDQSFTMETLMAVDIVGIWKELHAAHPEAAPSFAGEVPDWQRCFAAYDPSNHDPLVWREPFFRKDNIASLADEIRAQHRRYLVEHPSAFLTVKLRTFANPFGFPKPLGPWYFGPTPDLYLDLMGIPELTLRPLCLRLTVFAEFSLWRFFGHLSGLFRPWLWWLAWCALLGWRMARRRLDAVDQCLFLLAAAYFLTFFPFSNGFLLRYAFPLWMLFCIATIRLVLPAKSHPIP